MEKMERTVERGFIDPEDMDDAHLAHLNLNNIPATDADIYLQVTDIRRKIKEPGADIMKFAERIEDMVDIVKKAARHPANKDEENFMGLVANKLAVLSMQLQMAQKKKQLKK